VLEQRVGEFGTAAEAGEKPAPLVLTSDDLNALIANHPSWRLIRGKVYVSMQDDQVTGDIALPLDDFVEHIPRMSRLEGRYLNGTATLRVVLVDEILVVSLRSLKIKGEELPSELMDELRKRNLVDKSQANAITDKLESIEVKDGKLTIKARPGK